MRAATRATVLLVTLSISGCDGRIGDYMPVSSVSENGFARNLLALRDQNGREFKLWGYVDFGNIYGDEGARGILRDFWAGEGPTASTWRFDLKAEERGAIGKGVPVHAPNDETRDALLELFLTDARAHRSTRVFVRGRLIVFDAPTNVASLKGLRIELRSSDDILLAPPGD